MKPVTTINSNWSQSKHREGLSLDQMQAFDLIHDWYNSKPDMPFVLRGYAGTGKTFLIQRVIKSFQECFHVQEGSKNCCFESCFVRSNPQSQTRIRRDGNISLLKSTYLNSPQFTSRYAWGV